METNQKRTLYMSLAAIFLVGFLESISKNAINVAVIPLTKAFDLDASQIGFVLSLFFATYSVMSFFGGVLADRFGSKKVLVVSVALAAVSSCFTGIVPSFGALLLARGLLGLSQGVYPAVSSVSIAELFPKEKRGTGKSFLTSASPLGVAFGSILISALTVKFGWRIAFAIIGGMLAIAGAIFFLVYKPLQPKLSASNKQGTKIPFTTVLKIPLIWKLVICNFGMGVFLWGMVPWLPTYFSKVKHLDMVTVGTLSSIPPLGSFVFMIFSGYLIDNYFKGRERIFLCVTSAVSAIFIGLIYTADSIGFAFTYYTIANVILGLAVPLIYILVLKYVKNEIIGKCSGILAFSQQIAGFVAPIIMGYLVTFFNGSYLPIFIFMIATIIVVFFIALTLNVEKDIPKEVRVESVIKDDIFA